MKTQRPGPGPHPQPPAQPNTPSGTSGALEEKITHLTEEAAKTAGRFKVPILVAIVAVIAIVAVSGLVSTISRQQDGARSEKLYQLFTMDDAKIRTDGAALRVEFEGTRIEPAFISRYARWLYEQNQPGDREQAIAIVAAARGRHQNSLILELTANELDQVHAANAGFELPTLPLPPAVEPLPVAPVVPVFPPAPEQPPAEKSAEGDATPPPDPGQAPGSGGR